jgi:hypothetical protein
VRTFLPRRENWNLRLRLDLILTDITYMTDSLEFSKILFDDSRNRMDKTYKNIVLLTLAYTSCLFCLNCVYRPSKIHIKHVYNKQLGRFEQIELILINDPFIRFLIPSLFYEFPMLISRTIIFYGNRTVNWENFTFLLRNVVCVFFTFAAYFEIKELNVENIYYSNDYV